MKITPHNKITAFKLHSYLPSGVKLVDMAEVLIQLVAVAIEDQYKLIFCHRLCVCVCVCVCTCVCAHVQTMV